MTRRQRQIIQDRKNFAIQRVGGWLFVLGLLLLLAFVRMDVAHGAAKCDDYNVSMTKMVDFFPDTIYLSVYLDKEQTKSFFEKTGLTAIADKHGVKHVGFFTSAVDDFKTTAFMAYDLDGCVIPELYFREEMDPKTFEALKEVGAKFKTYVKGDAI